MSNPARRTHDRRALPSRLALPLGLGLCLAWSSLALPPVAGAQEYLEGDPDAAILERFSRRHETPFIALGYTMALGAGDLNEFIDDVSFRGFDFAVFWPVYRSLFLGASFGYNGFYGETGRDQFALESGTVTASLYRYADAWPFALAARYLFLEAQSMFRPYLGLRLGINWMVTSTYVVDRSYEDSSTGLLIAPEVGLQFQLADTVSAQLSYQFSFTTASTFSGDELSYNVFQLGLAFRL